MIKLNDSKESKVGLFFVWYLNLNLSGFVGPTRKINSGRHCSRRHQDTQAPLPQQGGVPQGGGGVGEEDCGSDHFPIFLSHNEPPEKQWVRRWKLHKADWDVYKWLSTQQLTGYWRPCYRTLLCYSTYNIKEVYPWNLWKSSMFKQNKWSETQRKCSEWVSEYWGFTAHRQVFSHL